MASGQRTIRAIERHIGTRRHVGRFVALPALGPRTKRAVEYWVLLTLTVVHCNTLVQLERTCSNVLLAPSIEEGLGGRSSSGTSSISGARPSTRACSPSAAAARAARHTRHATAGNRFETGCSGPVPTAQAHSSAHFSFRGVGRLGHSASWHWTRLSELLAFSSRGPGTSVALQGSSLGLGIDVSISGSVGDTLCFTHS